MQRIDNILQRINLSLRDKSHIMHIPYISVRTNTLYINDPAFDAYSHRATLGPARIDTPTIIADNHNVIQIIDYRLLQKFIVTDTRTHYYIKLLCLVDKHVPVVITTCKITYNIKEEYYE